MLTDAFYYDDNRLEFVADDGSWRLSYGLQEGIFEFGECKYSFSVDVYQKTDGSIWIWFSPITMKLLSGEECPSKETVSNIVRKVLTVSFNGNVELDADPVIDRSSDEGK